LIISALALGTILRYWITVPGGDLRGVIQYIPYEPPAIENGPSYLPSGGIAPDLDLHAIISDGRHSGMNYETDEYENQIPGAVVSGDLWQDDEWIFVPEGTEVKYYVSSRDIQQFLRENPDIAQQLPSTEERYTLSAVYYDSQSQRFDSQPLQNLTINPGENVIHTLSGTTDISVSQGVVDNAGPIITRTPLQNEYALNAAPVVFDFSAVDDGVGIKEITATLDGQPISSGATIPFTTPGRHTIVLTATDLLGNTTNETLNFDVIYQFSGFLPPIKPDGSGIYNLGRTLPVKFRLTDANGQFIPTAVAKLFTAKIQDGIVGTDEIPLSASAADTGNQFRVSDNQYIFNLSTDTLSAGTWQLKAVLDDGRDYTVVISIR